MSDLMDQAKVDAAIDGMCGAARESGCNLLEAATAARSVHAALVAMMDERVAGLYSAEPSPKKRRRKKPAKSSSPAHASRDAK